MVFSIARDRTNVGWFSHLAVFKILSNKILSETLTEKDQVMSFATQSITLGSKNKLIYPQELEPSVEHVRRLLCVEVLGPCQQLRSCRAGQLPIKCSWAGLDLLSS